MADECKLCALLGATAMDDISENVMAHTELHARQLVLINRSEDNFDENLVVQKEYSEARNKRFPTEKATKSVLTKICRELVKIYDKGCGIKCSQCNRSIKGGTTFRLVNHACVHLNKDLFACRQCDWKFATNASVCSHLKITHDLNGIRANYIDMTDDHQNDIMDMLKLCFHKAPQKRLNVTPFGKRKRNIQGQDPLMKLVYGFVAKHEHEDCIKCNLCSSSIPNHRKHNTAKMVLDHARWHLDKPIFTCRLCQYSVSTRGTVAVHLRNSHSVARSNRNFKDRSSEYFKEISSMLEDCYGEVKERLPALTVSKEEKRTRFAQSRIRSQCGANPLRAERQLRCTELAKRFQRSGKLQCRICHAYLAVVTTKQTNYVNESMRHALAHFNKTLFTCRRCSHTSTTKHAMGIHVRRKHGVPETDEFNDRTDDFHSEFMDMLSNCFDWDLEPVRPEGSIRVTPKSYLYITPKMHGNDLKAARHVHALELIRKHAMSGKIICRICTHPTSVLGGSQFVFYHARTHLDRGFWPYRCKLCSHKSPQRSNIWSHLHKVHKVKDAGEFEDMSDKFHSEIMNILSKCYGDTQ